MSRSDCPFTAAAYAVESSRKRGHAIASSALAIAWDAGRDHEATHAAAAALHGEAKKNDQDLAWARDFLILAAQHPEAMLRFRDALEAGAGYDEAELAALGPDRRRGAVLATPLGSSTARILQSTKAAAR